MAATVLNDFSTTLAAPLAIDGTTVTVTTGAPAAAVGQELRIRVGREILRVTVDTATSWTVLERAAEDAARFPAQAHDAGTRVLAPWTVEGLAEFVAENSTPFDEAAFLAAAHTWGDAQTFAGQVTAQTDLVVGGTADVTALSATAAAFGRVDGPFLVWNPAGAVGTHAVTLDHDLTRGVLRSLSGGLAVRNAADTADVLTVSDGGNVTARQFRSSGGGGTAADPAIYIDNPSAVLPVVRWVTHAGSEGLKFYSGSSLVCSIQDNGYVVPLQGVQFPNGTLVGNIGFASGINHRFSLGVPVDGDSHRLDSHNQTTQQLVGYARTSTTDGVEMWAERAAWAESTHAIRRAQQIKTISDAGGNREVARDESDGSRGYRIHTVHATAPADSMLPNGSVAFYTDGSGNLAVKLKDSGGTVRTGTVTLT